jgi:hypothetical protein
VFPYIDLNLLDFYIDIKDSRLKNYAFSEQYTRNQMASWSGDQLKSALGLTGNGYLVWSNVEFNEFKYCTSVTEYDAHNSSFRSSSLTEITLPENLRYFSDCFSDGFKV